MRNRAYGWYARDLELRRKRRAERPRCAARGCEQAGVHEWIGEWRKHLLCTRHWRLYREHERILSRIREL